MVRLQRKVKIQNTIKVNVQVILLFIFTIFFYLQNMTMLSTTLCNLMMVAAGSGCFFYEISCKKNGITSTVILYTIIMIILAFLCKSVTNNKSIQFILSIVSYSGIALVLLYEDINPKIYKKAYYIAVVWYVMRYLLGLANQYIIAVNGKEQNIFVKGGVLSTDIVLLMLYLLMAVTCYSKGEKVGYLPVLAGTVPVFLSLKRMGIIIWAILLFYQLVYDEKKSKFKVVKAIPIVIVVILLAGFLATQIFTTYLLRLIARFQNDGFTIAGLAGSRSGIWAAYINHFWKPQNFIFGVSFEVEEILRLYRGNAHNVILNCHATVGIVGVLINLILCIRAYIWYIKRKHLYLAGLGVILLLRGMSDYVFWFNWGDIIWLLIVLYPQFVDVKDSRCKKSARAIKEKQYEV